jgi:hypothetical protein
LPANAPKLTAIPIAAANAVSFILVLVLISFTLFFASC